ncbi:MAG: APC family permease [Dehalobacterium sp.]
MAGAYPVAGSAYAYTQRAINPHLGFLSGWAILLDYALFPILNYIVIAIYVSTLVPSIPYWGTVIASILIVTIVNLLGIKSLSKVNNALVIFMFIAVAYFIIASFTSLTAGVGSGFTMLPFYNPETFEMSALLLGTSIACFSFMGFDAMTTLAEEVRNPGKTLSKATIIVCFFMGFLFVLQAYFAQAVFPDFSKFTNLDSAFFDVAVTAGGQSLGTFISIAMIAGALANAIDSQAGVARVLYGMGRDEVIPKKFFAYLHPKTKVPAYTILLMAVLAIVGATQGLEMIITMINFGALTAFMFVNLSVIAHFYIRSNQRGGAGFVKFLLMPLIGFTTCFILFISLSSTAKLAGFSWLAVGLIYLAFSTNFFRNKPKILDM